MTALVGGLVAVALGLIGLGMWWREFLTLLLGGIPLLLLLGGALAVYLGFEETKDKFFKKSETPAYEPPKVSEAETEQYKAEVERLKKEVEDLKTKKKEK
jgi:cell division protein FtsB